MMIKKNMGDCRSDCLYCGYNVAFSRYKYMLYTLEILGIKVSKPDHAEVLLYNIAGRLMCI